MTDKSETPIDEEQTPERALVPTPKILVPTPIITAPTASVVSRRFNVHAIASIRPHSKWNLDFFKVGQSSRFARYSGGPGIGFIEFVAPDGLPTGVSMYFKIEYRDALTTIYSPWATSRTFKIAAPILSPVITYPTEGASLTPNQIQIQGSCEIGATTVTVTDSHGTPIKNAYVNSPVGGWALDYPWKSGEKNIRVFQEVKGVRSPLSGIRTFYTKPYVPVITYPTQNASLTPDQIQIQGSCEIGATAVTVTDVFGNRIADAYVNSPVGGWALDYPWTPGEKNIGAVQMVNGVRSELSGIRTFYTKPYVPAITNPGVVRTPRPTITGTGTSGAIVKLYEAGVGTIVFATAPVSNGTWTALLTQDLWMADPFNLTASQTLNNIESTYADTVKFAVLFKPQIVSITVSADGKPTVSGKGGLSGAKLEIWKSGGGGVVLLTTDVLANGTWSVSATTAWLAGEYSIWAKQIGKVTKQESDWSDEKSFTVTLSKPAITNPGVVRTPRPTITGTGTSGAIVKLYEAGVGTIVFATAPVSNGTWTALLTRDLWMADPFNLTASQTLNNIESTYADTVKFAVLFKPQIVSVTVSADGKPTVSGKGGLSGAKLEIWKSGGGGGVLLTTDVLANGTWSVSATTAWLAGEYFIWAKQIGKVTKQESDWSDEKSFTVTLSKPAITNPGVVRTPRPTITGTGTSGAIVKLYEAGVGTIVFATAPVSNGTWTALLTRDLWMADPFNLTASQTLNNIESTYADTVKFAVLFKPQIVSVTVSADGKPTVSGKGGLSGAKLEIWKSGGGGGALLTTDVLANGTWSVSATTAWLAGEYFIWAKQIGKVTKQESDWSDEKSFTVTLSKPAITNPGVVRTPRPTITGTGTSGAIVKLYEAGVGTIVFATAPVSNGTWTALLTRDLWMADPFNLTASQTLNNIESTYADTVKFAVLFKPQIVSVTVSADGKPTVSGKGGLSGAKLEIWKSGGGDDGVLLTTDVLANGTWSVSATTAWLAGEYSIWAKQIGKVTKQESGWSDGVSFTVKPKPAKLTIEELVSPVPHAQKLTIMGVYPGPETVKLEMLDGNGVIVEGWFSDHGDRVNFTPNPPWVPGTNEVMARQTVNNVVSDPSDSLTFTVKPSTLLITPPTSPAEQNQVIRGTGGYYKGATLTIFNSANQPVLGTYTQYGMDWTFTRIQPWEPGVNTIYAVQTVADVDSTPSDTCTFEVKPGKPVITPLTSPVGPDQVISGTGLYPGATLKMLDTANQPVLGTFTQKDTEWEFTPEKDWLPGITVVTVVQTVGEVASDPSDPCPIEVTLAPPEFTGPTNPTDSRPIFEGTGFESATVYVAQQGNNDEYLAVTTVVNGTWTAPLDETHPALPPGLCPIRALQTFNKAASIWSLFEIKIKPSTPVITPLTSPVGPDQVISGTGLYPGATLKMLDTANQPIPGKLATDDANWEFTPEKDWPPGENTIKAVQTVNTVESDPSDECTVTVEVGEKPDAPRFELPEAGYQVSRFLNIKACGLPLSRMTVRLAGEIELHSGPADDKGILEFAVETPLDPGEHYLEVKQKGNGPESNWSTPHRFIAKTQPKAPVTERPTEGSETGRKPRITGKGESRGQISLHHEDDPDNPFATTNGTNNWSWTAKDQWDVGTYTIKVQQTDDGDSSDWSETRTFKVIETRYAIGDASPVLAQPVVNKESALLRVQVVSGETGEAVEGVTVEWRFKGEQDVIATTRTNSLGRTEYRYTPDTAGTKEILADITQDNQGVVMTERFEVTALSRNEWAQETTLYLNEKPVDLSKGELELLSDEPYKLQLEVNSGSVLIGSSVMLEDLSDAETLGLKFDPPLSEPQPLKEGQPVSWDITCDPDKTGYFALKLIGQKLPDWYLPGLVIAKNPNEDVELYLDTSSMLFGGTPAYPCIGATHTLTVKPKDHSSLLGKYVTLEVTEEAAGLGVSVRPDPSIPQKLEVRGMPWTLSCVNSTKSGTFSVRLKVLEWDFSSLPLSMSLGHNKVKVIDRDGPREIGGAGGRWRTGVCVASEFTGQVVAVPVTVCISDNPSERSTDSDGWIYVFHEKEESVTFTLHNLYDGSTAGQ